MPYLTTFVMSEPSVTDDSTPGLLAICATCTKLQTFEVRGSYNALFSDQLLAAVGTLPQLQLLILKQGTYGVHTRNRRCTSEGMVSLVAAGAECKLYKLFLQNIGETESREQLKVACRACPALRSVNVV
eukprot:19153-Heterococcus_DN1.PRE.1